MSQFVLPEPPARRGPRTGLARVWSLADVGEADQTTLRPFVHGVAWQGDQTLDPQPIESGCATPDTVTVNTVVPTIRSLPPFHLVQTARCSNSGQRAVDDGAERARRALNLSESWGVERLLSNGGDAASAAANIFDDGQEGIAYFSDDTTVTVADDTNVSVVRAIGGLEAQYVAAEHAVGTHHVTLPVFYAMIDAGIAQMTENRWRTPGGFLISAGAGYTGAAKDNSAAAAGTSWAYTTGDVSAWRDPTFELESRGHVGDGDQDNAHIVQVQRQYVIAPAGETWLGAQVAL